MVCLLYVIVCFIYQTSLCLMFGTLFSANFFLHLTLNIVTIKNLYLQPGHVINQNSIISCFLYWSSVCLSICLSVCLSVCLFELGCLTIWPHHMQRLLVCIQYADQSENCLNFNIGRFHSVFQCLFDVFTGVWTSTLHTFQEASCDGEPMKMSCPPGMLVSIQFAQYGRQVPSTEMCPRLEQSDQPKPSNPWQQKYQDEDTNCLATTSLTVSFTSSIFITTLV